ncbi:MAG: hypothetical protein ABW139_20060 [Candidatus Thiodiazotropha sp. DIVDIV]
MSAERLFELIKTHRENHDLIVLYGVILYTKGNANVVKVLADNEYWDSFDVLSGKHWMVYAIRKDSADMKTAIKNLVISELQDTLNLVIPDDNEISGFIKSIGNRISQTKSIMQVLEISESEKLPLLLLFSQDPSGDIMKLTLPIKDETIENTYDCIRQYFLVISAAAENISAENRKNPEGVYGAIHLAIDHHTNWERLKNSFNLLKVIRSLGKVVGL